MKNLLTGAASLLVTCIFSTAAVAQETDVYAMCSEAAQGLLPEDVQPYIENCTADYNANHGHANAAPILVQDEEYDAAEPDEPILDPDAAIEPDSQ